MKLSDFLKLRGGIEIRKSGILVFQTPNVITTIGKQRFVSHAATLANTNYVFSHLGIGIGTDAASSEDLALTSEYYRKSLTVFAAGIAIYGTTTFTGNNVDTYLGVSLGSGSYNITELGLLDALSGGNLIARQVVTQVDFTGNEEVEVIWGVIVE